GEAPSHPELLDFLALRFVEQGWSVKKLIREIMLSHVYQQSSDAAAAAADPENRLLGRMNRRRLDAESIRDAILAVSGPLDLTAGGRTVTKTPLERNHKFEDTRRSVYTPVFRNRLLELFEVFDFADPNICMGRRTVSTVAPQALYLLNSPFVMDQARRAAVKALAVADLNDAGRGDRGYRGALGPVPTGRERPRGRYFLGGGGQASEERAGGW